MIHLFLHTTVSTTITIADTIPAKEARSCNLRLTNHWLAKQMNSNLEFLIMQDGGNTVQNEYSKNN